MYCLCSVPCPALPCPCLPATLQEGTWSATFEQRYTAVTGAAWAPGSSVGIYRNTQRPSTSWYHDTT